MRKPIHVEVNGIYYNSLNIAGRAIGTDEMTIKRRCINEIFTNYIFTDYKLPKEKICTVCGKPKLLKEFKLDKSRNDKRSSWCKKCYSTYTTKNVNRKLANINALKYIKTERGRIITKVNKIARKQRECMYIPTKKEKEIMWDMYAEMRKRRREGEDITIDHIQPLAKGGLHKPDNLQFLTFNENRRKGCKLNYEIKI